MQNAEPIYDDWLPAPANREIARRAEERRHAETAAEDAARRLRAAQAAYSSATHDAYRRQAAADVLFANTMEEQPRGTPADEGNAAERALHTAYLAALGYGAPTADEADDDEPTADDYARAAARHWDVRHGGN